MTEPTVRLVDPGKDDVREFRDVQRDAWTGELAEADLMPVNAFRAAAELDHLVGAFVDGNPVGFTYSMRAGDEVYVHLVGVVKAHREDGIGKGLLEHTRDHWGEQGYDRLAWMYDPLDGGNANLYVNNLGGTVVKFVPDYWDFEDDTHRFRLELPTEEVRRADPDPDTTLLAVDETTQEPRWQHDDGWRGWSRGGPDAVAVEVPWDVYHDDFPGDVRPAWKEAILKAFGVLLPSERRPGDVDPGAYRVTGFQKGSDAGGADPNTYVLTRQS